MKLLVLDPENADERRQRWRSTFSSADLTFATDLPAAATALRNAGWHVCAVYLPVDGWTADELLDEFQRLNGLVPLLFFDVSGTTEEAIRLTKQGAFHYFDREPSEHSFQLAVEAAVEFRRSRELALFGHSLTHEPWRKYLVGESHAMQNLARVIRLVGPRRCTVLITGETGTGKEMAARAIHMASNRSHLPLVAVNCHALPESLLEAELFGHVKGAFTGASAMRIGRFEQAHRSTLFLDEIGDMPLEVQAKLLRVLQEREIQRLGSSDTVQIDVRVVAATNVDLLERVRQGSFREDLYYRLNVVPIRTPPLRERTADIPLLVHHFIDKISRQEDLPAKEVAPETLERLRRYQWPGNVRQLENAIEMAIALSGDRMVLFPSDFPLPAPSEYKPSAPALNGGAMELPEDGIDFESTIANLERSLFQQALNRSGGNKKMAADLLGLKRTTFTAKLKALDETVPLAM